MCLRGARSSQGRAFRVSAIDLAVAETKVPSVSIHCILSLYLFLCNIYGTVSAKIAPRLKCYKNASRLNRYNFPTDNAIDFLVSTLHSEMV